MKKNLVGIIGLGYVGLPMLHLLSKKKINCYGFDIDNNKIECLKKNISYISDLKNNELKVINKSKVFNINKVNENIIRQLDYIIFTLPTPLTSKLNPDISMIENAFNKVKKYLRKGQTIILESTVYPGATKKIFCNFLQKKFNLGKNFYLCYSSERISPGQTNKKKFKFFLQNITKVVSGYSQPCLQKISHLYKKIFKNIYLAESLEEAEMSKLVENLYRSVNIGLVNELKIICSKINLNIHKVLKVAETKPFGFTAFYPGPGVGGHCIPIDPVFVSWLAKKNNVSANFVKLARRINLNITNWVLNKIINWDLKIRSKKIKKKFLIIGMAYKPDVNDTRESPSFKIFRKLLSMNNIVEYHDTKVKKIFVNKKFYFSKKINESKNYDYVIISTAHSNLNKKILLKNSKLIFDTRGIFSNINSNKIIHI